MAAITTDLLKRNVGMGAAYDFAVHEPKELPNASPEISRSVASAKRTDLDESIERAGTSCEIAFTSPDGLIQEFRTSKINGNFAISFGFRGLKSRDIDPGNLLVQLDKDPKIHGLFPQIYKMQKDLKGNEISVTLYIIEHETYNGLEDALAILEKNGWIPHDLLSATKKEFNSKKINDDGKE